MEKNVDFITLQLFCKYCKTEHRNGEWIAVCAYPNNEDDTPKCTAFYCPCIKKLFK